MKAISPASVFKRAEIALDGCVIRVMKLLFSVRPREMVEKIFDRRCMKITQSRDRHKGQGGLRMHLFWAEINRGYASCPVKTCDLGDGGHDSELQISRLPLSKIAS